MRLTIATHTDAVRVYPLPHVLCFDDSGVRYTLFPNADSAMAVLVLYLLPDDDRGDLGPTGDRWNLRRGWPNGGPPDLAWFFEPGAWMPWKEEA